MKYFCIALGIVFGAACVLAWRSEGEKYETDGFFFPLPRTPEERKAWSRERIIRLINEQLDSYEVR